MNQYIGQSAVLSAEKPSGSGTVLLIEDEAHVAGVVARSLATHRYRVQTAVTAQDGLRHARECAVEAIIIDALLSDVGGFDLCRALREHAMTRWTPIVMLTALGSEEDRVRAFDAGADCCVSHLFGLGDLPTCIRTLVGRTRNTPAPHRSSPIALVPRPATR